MATTSPVDVVGPFLGIEELLSPRSLPAQKLADAMNVIVRGGRLCPRPGYKIVKNAGFISPDTLLVTQNVVNGTNHSLRVDGTGGHVYYSCVLSPNTVIRKYNLATAAVTTPLTFVPAEGDIRAFDIDVAGNAFYFYNLTANKIQKCASLVSSGAITDIVSSAAIGANGVQDLVYFSGKVYWMEASGTPRLRSAVVSGLDVNVTTLATPGLAGTFSSALCIHTGTSQIFVVGHGTSPFVNIFRCGLDGSAPTTFPAVGAAVWKEVSSVTVDPANGKLYVGDFEEKFIWSCNLDGTDTKVAIAISPSVYNGPHNLHWDTVGLKLYYTTRQISDNQTNVWRAFSSISPVVLEPFPIYRSQSGAAVSQFAADLLLYQSLDVIQKKSWFGVYLTAGDVAFTLFGGFQNKAALNLPHTFVTNNRDANMLAGSAYVPTSHRASFAWMGGDLQSARGGALIAHNGVSRFTFHSPFIQNQSYVVGVGGATTGTFTLTYSGQTTASIAALSSAAFIQAALEALSTIAVGEVEVTGGLGGPWSVLFTGPLAGAPRTLTGAQTGLVLSIVPKRPGATYAPGLMTLHPAGMPRPTEVGPLLGSTYIAGGSMIGVYSYRITFYSSLWNTESPPSPLTNPTFQFIPNNQRVKLTWALPTTLPFKIESEGGPVGGPYIDRVRIYRKKYSSVPSLPPNFDNYTDNWYFIAEVDALIQSYTDADTTPTGDRLPFQNEYPPSNANYVVIDGAKAIYASSTPGDQNVWISEVYKQGGVPAGEDGFEYVRPDSSELLPSYVGSDVSINGLRAFAGMVLISTGTEVFRGLMAAPSDPSPSQISRMAHIQGMASHWCSASVDDSRESGRAVWWMTADGDVYEFDGISARLMTQSLDTTRRSLVRLAWRRDDLALPYLSSWYYASVALDSMENRLIFTAPVDMPGSYPRLQLVYDLYTQGWYKWDLPMTAPFEFRHFDAAAGQVGRKVMFFFDLNGNLCRLADGKGDNGAAFAWFYQFGKWALKRRHHEKRVEQLGMEFERRSFGGVGIADPTHDVTIDFGRESFTQNGLLFTHPDESIMQCAPKKRGRRVQIKVSGLQEDNTPHAELIGVMLDFETPGRTRVPT